MQTTTTLQIFNKNITQTIDVFDKNLKLSSTLNQSQKDLIEKNNFELEKICNDILLSFYFPRFNLFITFYKN